MYGNSDNYSQLYANANGIEYVATNIVSEDDLPNMNFSVDSGAGNTVIEEANPFAGQDLSQGVTISFSKYCNTDNWRNNSLINFSTGKRSDNSYFIIFATAASCLTTETAVPSAIITAILILIQAQRMR
jgi:hypothetical protein